MRLRHEIHIDAPPGRAFEFFRRMPDNYRRWHPDHVRFEWVTGTDLMRGTVFCFEERIDGRPLRRTAVFTSVIENRYLEFAPTNRLLRLLLPKLIFRFVPVADGFRFEAEIQVRTGPLGAWLNRREFDAIRRHMQEEGENLKRLLEQST
jgi:hypothetical protein